MSNNAPVAGIDMNLDSWSQEITATWRFARNNGITEGFHTKMEVLQRQAYGFRNFQNSRLRVRVMLFLRSVRSWMLA
jgi:transposase